MNRTFGGELFRVVVHNRTSKDTHLCVTVESEDDGDWFHVQTFSSHWLPELVDQLTAAKRFMDEECERDLYGYAEPARSGGREGVDHE